MCLVYGHCSASTTQGESHGQYWMCCVLAYRIIERIAFIPRDSCGNTECELSKVQDMIYIKPKEVWSLTVMTLIFPNLFMPTVICESSKVILQPYRSFMHLLNPLDPFATFPGCLCIMNISQDLISLTDTWAHRSPVPSSIHQCTWLPAPHQAHSLHWSTWHAMQHHQHHSNHQCHSHGQPHDATTLIPKCTTSSQLHSTLQMTLGPHLK